jgi:hypothetical protein
MHPVLKLAILSATLSAALVIATEPARPTKSGSQLLIEVIEHRTDGSTPAASLGVRYGELSRGAIR